MRYFFAFILSFVLVGNSFGQDTHKGDGSVNGEGQPVLLEKSVICAKLKSVYKATIIFRSAYYHGRFPRDCDVIQSKYRLIKVIPLSGGYSQIWGKATDGTIADWYTLSDSISWK